MAKEDINLNNYVTIKHFNKMVLRERIDIVNKMLVKYDLIRIKKHLGIDVEYLFWAFGYELKDNKFVEKSK